jgi:hypothetical protein
VDFPDNGRVDRFSFFYLPAWEFPPALWTPNKEYKSGFVGNKATGSYDVLRMQVALSPRRQFTIFEQR